MKKSRPTEPDGAAATDLDVRMKELREEEARKLNILIHQVEESTDTDPKVREKHDRDYMMELCHGPLGLQWFSDGNIAKLFRLGGKKAEGVRPLLIGLDSAVTKQRIMKSTRGLQGADERFSKISVQHDLTANQRKQVKDLIIEAKDMEAKDLSGNYIYRVRGPPGQKMVRRLTKK